MKLLTLCSKDAIHAMHCARVADLIQKGGILEWNALVQALLAHLDDCIIEYKKRCVVVAD